MDVKAIRQIVKNAIHDEFASVLKDISYRMGQLRELEAGLTRRITAFDLNMATPFLEGYTFTDDSPAAGSVAWADLNVVYKGTTHVVQDGSTADKYLWWELATPGVMQTGNVKPTLSLDDILIGINDNGAFQLTMSPGKMVPGGALVDGAVGSNELGSGAVTGTKIADLAIAEGKIAANAVTAGKIKDGEVNGSKIASGSITETKIGTGAVTSGKVGSGAITNTKLANGAVDSLKLGDGAVTSTKIGSKAVTTGALADGAVGATQLGSNAVTTGKLTDGAVTGVKLGAGSVAEDKLNMATHFLF